MKHQERQKLEDKVKARKAELDGIEMAHRNDTENYNRVTNARREKAQQLVGMIRQLEELLAVSKPAGTKKP